MEFIIIGCSYTIHLKKSSNLVFRSIWAVNHEVVGELAASVQALTPGGVTGWVCLVVISHLLPESVGTCP